ncbi:hypothetical protein [Aquimarina agarivorans]|uniref:hypothetical protein n=1 Tax=Aquimarina agarivorans TaxID=980584 RepID=UPI0002FD896C|nr:hypothetical protein [Aquimarina agarivorans]
MSFVFFCLYSLFQAQNNKNTIDLQTIFNYFEEKQQLQFSYDAELVNGIVLKINKKSEELSIEEIASLIEQQTKYKLEKVASNYILIKNTAAYTYCGILVDEQSQFELPEAVILKNDKMVTISNKKGVFYVDTTLQDQIKISYIGYKTKVIDPQKFLNKTCDTIYLQPKAENLSNVVVKEYLTKGIYKNKDASVHISTKGLRILPGLVEPDVLQSAQLLPGISSPTEDPANLYIRGGYTRSKSYFI